WTWARPYSKCDRHRATLTWAATISTNAWWTGLRRSSKRARASTCEQTAKPCSVSPKLPESQDRALGHGRGQHQPAVHHRRCLGTEAPRNESTRAKIEQLTADLVERCVGPVNRPSQTRRLPNATSMK